MSFRIRENQSGSSEWSLPGKGTTERAGTAEQQTGRRDAGGATPGPGLGSYGLGLRCWGGSGEGPTRLELRASAQALLCSLAVEPKPVLPRRPFSSKPFGSLASSRTASQSRSGAVGAVMLSGFSRWFRVRFILGTFCSSFFMINIYS